MQHRLGRRCLSGSPSSAIRWTVGPPGYGRQKLGNLIKRLTCRVILVLPRSSYSPHVVTYNNSVCPPDTKRAIKGGSACGSSRTGPKVSLHMMNSTHGRSRAHATAFVQHTPTKVHQSGQGQSSHQTHRRPQAQPRLFLRASLTTLSTFCR